MEIVNRPLDSIRPYEHNPPDNTAAVDAVAASLREFGFRQPLVVDPDGAIVCGHTRFKAVQKLGLSEIPVHVPRNLSPKQIKACRLADNKTAELAEWNLDLLPLELAELREAEYDLGLLGFGDEELAKLLGTELQKGLCDPDDVSDGKHVYLLKYFGWLAGRRHAPKTESVGDPYPIQKLDGIANGCAGQLYQGQRTHIGWTARDIALRSIAGSPASGGALSRCETRLSVSGSYPQYFLTVRRTKGITEGITAAKREGRQPDGRRPYFLHGLSLSQSRGDRI